jgi:hypothetical protein
MGSVNGFDETWVFLSELLGHIAMWAIRQSPYPVPENLEKVLRDFSEIVEQDFDVASQYKGGMRTFRTQREIEDLLEKYLFPLPEVQAWNRPKIEVEQYLEYDPTPTPDHDFIDLYALARNVAMGLITNEEDGRRRGVPSAELARREPHEDQTD